MGWALVRAFAGAYTDGRIHLDGSRTPDDLAAELIEGASLRGLPSNPLDGAEQLGVPAPKRLGLRGESRRLIDWRHSR